jgi:hypothetical protein
LLDEMDAIAGELRANAKHNEADDAIAFRQLLRARRPDLDGDQYLDLFDLWRDRYRSGLVAAGKDRDSRIAALRRRLDALLAVDRGPLTPPQRAAISVRIRAVAEELGGMLAKDRR